MLVRGMHENLYGKIPLHAGAQEGVGITGLRANSPASQLVNHLMTCILVQTGLIVF